MEPPGCVQEPVRAGVKVETAAHRTGCDGCGGGSVGAAGEGVRREGEADQVHAAGEERDGVRVPGVDRDGEVPGLRFDGGGGDAVPSLRERDPAGTAEDDAVGGEGRDAGRGGRLVHDDFVMADALTTELDKMKWVPFIEGGIIQAEDPIKWMNKNF